MDKDLSNVICEISTILSCHSQVKTVEQLLYRMPVPKEIEKSTCKFLDRRIFDIIVLTRIERLYDLKQISKEQKEELLFDYKNYQELCENNAKLLSENKRNDDVSKKLRVVYDRLNKYGLLNIFNCEQAFINQIDNEITNSKTYKKVK